MGKHLNALLVFGEKDTTKARNGLGQEVGDKENKLVYQDEKGNWHLENLSQEIRHFLGADYELNRDAKKDISIAELTKIRAHLSKKAGAELSEQEVKALIKLCGYDIEAKDWRKIVAGAVVGAAAGSLGGAVAQGVIRPRTPDINLNINNEITITGLGDINLSDLQLPEDVTVKAVNTSSFPLSSVIFGRWYRNSSAFL